MKKNPASKISLQEPLTNGFIILFVPFKLVDRYDCRAKIVNGRIYTIQGQLLPPIKIKQLKCKKKQLLVGLFIMLAYETKSNELCYFHFGNHPISIEYNFVFILYLYNYINCSHSDCHFHSCWSLFLVKLSFTGMHLLVLLFISNSRFDH